MMKRGNIVSRIPTVYIIILLVSYCCFLIPATLSIRGTDDNDIRSGHIRWSGTSEQQQQQQSDNNNVNPYLPLQNGVTELLNAFRTPIVQKIVKRMIPSVTEEDLLALNSEQIVHLSHSNDVEVVEDVSEEKSSLMTITRTMRTSSFNLDELTLGLHEEQELQQQQSNDTPPPENLCHGSALFASWNNVTYACNNHTVTREEYEILVEDPFNNCSMTNSTEFVCICPLDRSNRLCRAYRSFSCALEMLSPNLECELPPVSESYGGLNLDGDYPCLRYSMKDNVEFQYNMTCKFNVPPYSETKQAHLPRNETYRVYHRDGNETVMTWDEMQNSFEYFLNHNYTSIENGTEVVSGTFALTKPIEEPLTFKVFNFNSFSDRRGWSYVALDEPGYYIGEKRAHFGLKIAELSDDFFAGDRLYCEVRINDVAGLNMGWEKIYIDFSDRHLPVQNDVKRIALVTAIPLACVALAVTASIGLGLFMFNKFRRANNNKATEK